LNRSFLFAPANVARRVEKAFTLEADAVILDLEDSVAISDKVATRKQVRISLEKKGRARVYVRINAPSTPFCYGDLVETLQPGIHGIVVPKIESAADLHAIDWVMAALERERGIPEGSLDLMPLIETAAGVQRVDRALTAERLSPGQRLVEYDAEREDVPAVIDLAAADLLGRHVADRAERHPGSSRASPRVIRVGRRRRDLRQPEVQNLRVSVPGDQNVVGFQIAMDDALIVCHHERRGHLLREVEHGGGG